MVQAPHLFAQFGLKPPRGVLLWGPPGTGKSRLARAAAQAASAALLVVNGPDLLSAVYGESEAALKVPVSCSDNQLCTDDSVSLLLHNLNRASEIWPSAVYAALTSSS